jgi:hypothetical protein
MAYPQGDTLARAVAQRIHFCVATIAALAAIPIEERADGMTCVVTAGGSSWIYSLESTDVDPSGQLVLSPAVGFGAWHRLDKFVDLELPFDANTADGASLFLVPPGFRLRPTMPFWEIAVAMAGPAGATLGVSSSNPAFNAKGDLLGGAAGDSLDHLTAGAIGGTTGTKVGSPSTILVAGEGIVFNRIAQAPTSGSGFVHVPCEVLASP